MTLLRNGANLPDSQLAFEAELARESVEADIDALDVQAPRVFETARGQDHRRAFVEAMEAAGPAALAAIWAVGS